MSSTNQVFGGDEVGAVVVSIGGTTTKCGFGGEDAPRSVFASYTGTVPAAGAASMNPAGAAAQTASTGATAKMGAKSKIYVDQQLWLRTPGMEVKPVLQDGIVSDWEGVERLWQHALVSSLRINSSEHPLLLTEPTHNTAAARAKTAQLLFEQFKVPALYLAKDAVLTSFAFGRPTSVVLKSGAAYSCAVPVFEGHAMLRGVTRAPLAGDAMSDKLVSTLATQGHALRPRATLVRRETPAGSGKFEYEEVDSGTLHPTFSKFWQRQLATDIKASCCRTSLFPHLIATSQDTASFEMPDGKQVTLGANLVWGLAENLFARPAPPAVAASGAVAPPASQLVLADLVEQAVNKCDVDLKREFFANVIVSGGNTLWPGFTQRVGKALGERISQGIKLKVHTATTVRPCPALVFV